MNVASEILGVAKDILARRRFTEITVNMIDRSGVVLEWTFKEGSLEDAMAKESEYRRMMVEDVKVLQQQMPIQGHIEKVSQIKSFSDGEYTIMGRLPWVPGKAYTYGDVSYILRKEGW